MSDASPNTLVYVAYARADVARVEPVVAALRERGLHVHFNATAAHGSGGYVHESHRTLRDADALVVFVSRAAAQSHWVESETRAFQTQLARGGHRRLIPVRLDEIALPVALAPYTTVDAVDAAPATVASTLAHYLSAQPEAPASPAPAATSAAEQARQEAQAAEQVAAEQARQKARAAEWNRRWKLVQQAREREAAAAAPTEPGAAAPTEPEAAEAAAPAEPEDAAPAGDQLVWDGDQWAWASDQVVSRGGISEPPAPTPNTQDDTVKAPAVDRQPGMGSLGTLDWGAVEREVYGSDAESKSADNSLGSAAAEPPLAEKSDADSVPGGWSAPPKPVAPPPMPVAPPPRPPATVAPPAPQPITQPRVEAVPAAPPAPAPQAPGATPAVQPTRLEQVTFTAYHPREMQPQQWQPLVVYISLDNPATLALVSAAAADRLAGKLDQFRPGRADKPAGLARGTALRIVPVMPGFEFNPAYLDVTWQEDVQQHELRMRATSARPGQAANGVVQFYQGMLLRAEVPMSVFVGQAPARLDTPDAYARAIARAYRRVFASYSHRDMPVVESCETAARTMGDQYLRDVTLLQAGTQWDPRLIQAINDADVFQLFWSKRAATSPYVEREWRHALQLLPARPNFIRPVYWSRQLHPTPPELNALHFQPLSLSSLGWGWFRRTFYSD